MTPRQLAILRHALGLNPDGTGEPTRRGYYVPCESGDFAACRGLAADAYMIPVSVFLSGCDGYCVTPIGRQAAMEGV